MNGIKKIAVTAALAAALMNAPAIAHAAEAPTIEQLASKSTSTTEQHTKAAEALAKLDARLAEAREELAEVETVLPATPREEAQSVATAIGALFSPKLAERVGEISDGLEERKDLEAEIATLEGDRPELVEEVAESKADADQARVEYEAAQQAAAAAEAERVRAAGAANVRLMIDPGHGGKDPGAVNGAITEKGTNLDISMKVVEAAQRQGWTVGITRWGDWFVPLNARPSSANNWGATAFVSIHSNSGSAAPMGNMTIYRSAAGAALGQQIMEELDALTPYGDIGNRADVRGLAVLRGAHVPATLVEVMSLSSPEELAQLVSPDVQARYAEAIVKGVADFHGIAYVPPAGQAAPATAAAPSPAPVAQEVSTEATSSPEQKKDEKPASSEGTWLSDLFTMLAR